MKCLIYIFLLSYSVVSYSYDAIAIDNGVSKFLNKWFAEKCDDINHSFIYALEVETAYKMGFYKSIHPSELNPPELMTDVLVAVKTNVCGKEGGYLITFREGDELKVIGYSSFDQPE